MSRPIFLAVLVVSALVLSGAETALAQVSCPNSNPIVHENNCRGAGTTSYDLQNESENIAGFSTKTSYDLGESVPLKIARNAPLVPATRVDISVYRIGWYNGQGARLIPTAGANGVVVNNNFTCRPMDTTTGKLDCNNWNVTYTIPGSSLPASGVYIAKLRTTDNGIDNWVLFVVRDDDRVPEAKVLFKVPTASYQAYNTWGGKSLYFDVNGGPDTVTGTGRAAKVSFDRPTNNMDGQRDRFFGPDVSIVWWFERHGYDIAYTDDVQAHLDPAELRQHDIVAIGGHSEYWSLEQFNGFKAARDAGVGIANLGANTAYWKVRYEDGARTLVCYKTVQGDGSGGSGAITPNDWGPDGVQGTADDALGADGRAGTADDRPQNSTTTFRDNGAPPGDPTAPAGGRVGPNLPENSLFGAMYVGDDDNFPYQLRVPPANANAEFKGDRFWRNTGIPANGTTTLGTNVVGWEWDAVPTQAQYLAFQPSGVTRLSDSPISGGSPSWLLDEGKDRALTPPAGQPSAVQAVKYRAASGAWVFSAGTNWWGEGLEEQEISQAMYNMYSDMGVQPLTPSGLVLDPGGGNQPPAAAFTISANPVAPNTPVQFNGSSSSDSDGSIVRYEWDLDGNGSFETDTGTNPQATRTYTAEGTFDVRLRVTDNGGASDLTVRTLQVIGNQPPTAAVTATPNPAVVTQPISFSGSGSSDPDGSITRYEWDLDGNGSYERDTGGTASTSTSYDTAGTRTVGLRVTDNGGKTALASVPVTVSAGGQSNYGDAVLDTPGLVSYWRMGETTGPTFADSKGASPATAGGGVTFGVAGGVPGDSDRSARFDGANGHASANLNLSGTSTVTVEFWLNWNAYASDDDLAMEFTPNFNGTDGGFLIDPNAPQTGGAFGVGIGNGTGRNNAYFTRPSAGQWHHYAIVLDRTAPAAQQITPYVDGQPVTYTKTSSGTGGPFANSTLYMMSRAGTALFGQGDLDEVAIYNRALSSATISEHYNSFGSNRRPVARFTANPNPAAVGQTVTFNGSTSSDPDGSITRYEWDLDGNGSYETNGGTNAQVTRSYTSAGNVEVGLRVTDNGFATDTTTQTLQVGSTNAPPNVSFTATPNPAAVGQTVNFDASATSDPDGSITRLEWDLDGNGSYETDTGTTRTTSRAYSAAGTVTVGLRATDNGGRTATGSVPLTVNAGGTSSYGDAVLGTAGLVNYWRLGEASGTTLADSKGTSPATAAGGVTLGVPGGISGDPNTAARFDGTDDRASAAVNLSSATAVTVEFWLNWNAFANDDDLAMEFTPNFNSNAGGFLIDPNSPGSGGRFGIGMGNGANRNNAYFVRPSAGQWHHYAIVLDRTAPGAQQITPYVDGQAVSYTKASSGTGGGFANSTLYMMSRAGTALFGQGDLDEVAIYNRALSAATVSDHYNSRGTNRRPTAAFTANPNPATPGQTVTFNGSGSSDPDGTITRYEWDLDGNGSFETNGGTNPQTTRSYTTEGPVTVRLRVTDNTGATDDEEITLTVASGNSPPTASFTASPNPANLNQTVTFNGSGSSDPDGSVTRYEWDLDGDGSYETDTGATATTTRAYTTAGTRTIGLRVTDNGGRTATTTRSLAVNGASTYRDVVLATSGLLSYWRMGEASGTSFADSKGTSAATIGSATLGVPGAITGDANAAARFNGTTNFARADINLSTTSTITVEFWLKWNAFANDDDLALEFTPNFNANNGGFLVDPNAANGWFGLGLGRGGSRNTTYFTRPSAGQWHHYAFVFNSTAPAAQQIIPYVDGQAVTYIKGNNGTGAGAFANARLFFMSRGGASLFGAGDLDELAVYTGALNAATVAQHYSAGRP